MKAKVLIIISMGMLIITSCSKYPPSSGRLTEDLVIYTKYDVSANFNNYKTFAIVDSITYIDANDSGNILNPEAQALLNRITLDMEGRGFQKKDRNAIPKPDLGINVAVVKNTNVTVYYPGWYWGYYPPYWWGYNGYDYWYPYYPTYISTYSTGTVIIDLVDLKYPTADNKLYIRWNAYIRALLTGNHSQSEILQSIDQAFTQTPTLKTTP